jgi:hypothetical protein
MFTLRVTKFNINRNVNFAHTVHYVLSFLSEQTAITSL